LGCNWFIKDSLLLRPDGKSAILEELNPQIDFGILEKIGNDEPAVDGMTGVQSLTVDNLFWKFYTEVRKVATQLME
jgi:hypothetical protein